MKLIVRIILICLAAFLLSIAPSQGIEHPVHKVLILHLYHHGFPWTDDIMTGIDSVFKESDSDIQMFVEYMDTKRHDTQDFYPLLHEMYRRRYREEQIDLIIVSDNNGLEFLLRYRDQLFPGIPVVFCGINNFSDAMITGHTGITGVAENMSIKDTISLAQRLNPEINQIVVVNDTTPAGSVYCIEDNGIGIAPEDYDRIFNIFYRGSTDAAGEGIGLAIIKRILERHNGRIWVESNPDKGSIFYVQLPARRTRLAGKAGRITAWKQGSDEALFFSH